jgi:hypothetical protein
VHRITIPPLTGTDDDSLSASYDHFVPTSSGPRLRESRQDLLGDEHKALTDALEMFVEPPKMKWSHLENDDLELCHGLTIQNIRSNINVPNPIDICCGEMISRTNKTDF